MKQLRQAAARERRIPLFWWFLVMLVMGMALFLLLYQRSPHAAYLMGVLLAAAWAAPVLALFSMAAPRRAQHPMPVPGEGSYDAWLAQARLIGRTLIYYDENREFPEPLRHSIRAALSDLRDTLGAHPLRDDLERVCQRIRQGAIREVQDWLWRTNAGVVRNVLRQYQEDVEKAVDEDDRLVALQHAVENAAAQMTRRCMPRMLERERLVCARDCAWLAAQTASHHGRHLSPIELAAALVVEWSDLSQPWQPIRMLHRAAARLAAEEAAAAPVPAAGTGAPAPAGASKHVRRVRVKVRRKYHHARRYRGPTILDILLSFGQWVRYSVRSWTLYR